MKTVGPFVRRLFLCAAVLFGAATNSRANALDSWQPAVLPTTHGLLTICAGDVGLVAAGANGAIVRASGGFSWSDRSINAAIDFHGVAWGNGTFVLVGTAGAVWTSPNGMEWTDQLSPTNQNLNAIAFGNGVFIACGAGGLILTSTNGVDWSFRDAATTADLSAACFGNDRFVIVGAGGTVLTSLDNGATWIKQASGKSTALLGVAHNCCTFVAVGAGGAIMASLDTTNWTSRSSSVTQDLNAVAYGRGFTGEPNATATFLAAGNSGQIVSSSDGFTWTNRASGITQGLHGVAFASQSFVVVGGAGTILQSDFMAVVDPLPRHLGPIVRQPDGTVQNTVSPAGGTLFCIQATYGLSHWFTVTNFFNLTNSTLQWIDPAATNSAARFYRLCTP